MDEAQVLALLDSLKQEILGAVDQKNQGLAASLTKEIKKAVPPATPPADGAGDSAGDGKLSLKALQQQITDLNAQLESEKQATLAQAQQAELSQAIAASGTNAPNALTKVLAGDLLPKLSREGDQWFVADGDSVVSLTDSIKAYLGTDEGAWFLPARATNGSGATESATAAPTTAGGAALTTSAFESAFSNLV
jgi:hypothetical protein